MGICRNALLGFYAIDYLTEKIKGENYFSSQRFEDPIQNISKKIPPAIAGDFGNFQFYLNDFLIFQKYGSDRTVMWKLHDQLFTIEQKLDALTSIVPNNCYYIKLPTTTTLKKSYVVFDLIRPRIVPLFDSEWKVINSEGGREIGFSKTIFDQIAITSPLQASFVFVHEWLATIYRDPIVVARLNWQLHESYLTR
ncbi:MAG: hypothetical protein KBD78_09545 [Oligoflexales bacterium]|nr:hypothetical protein [Oligoflexales bacterium]